MPLLFLVFWIVLNGRITLEVIATGIFVTILVSLFTYKLIGIDRFREKKVWNKLFSIIAYLFSLIIEVVKANIHMINIVLAPVIEIKPQIVYFKSPVRSDAAKVALANSITLTPGTISIKLDDDTVGIHAIDKPLAVGIEESTFVKKLKEIEGGH